MGRRRIDLESGRLAVHAIAEGSDDRATLALAVRFLLEELAESAPGRSVEVRVPPFGAVQCLPGSTHTRGTPPNVIETDPVTWVALALGQLTWQEARASARVSASGARADLSDVLPVIGPDDAR